MNSDANPVVSLALTFGWMSLFAVGGGNSAIPEMHRVAVDVHHWMTDRQFADVFAISQLSPGPNVLIVTLIGYAVAGVAGGLVATLAMCVPTAVLAYYVSRLLRRSSHARWPAIVQAALRPGAGAGFRPDLGRRPDDCGCRGGGFRDPAQSALVAAGRGAFGLCRRDRVARCPPLPSP
jgi:hypothetical protein